MPLLSLGFSLILGGLISVVNEHHMLTHCTGYYVMLKCIFSIMYIFICVPWNSYFERKPGI